MNKVFISATSVDLSEYVKEVSEHLSKAGYQPVSMIHFGAQPEDATTVSLSEIDSTELFVGIYGRRYGYIPDGSHQSVTEQEYHHAREQCKPTFAFLVDPQNTELTPGPGEDDGGDEAVAKQERLHHFLSQIETTVVRESFQDRADLAGKVLASLTRYQQRPRIVQPPVPCLRIRLKDGKVQALYNDRELGTSPIVINTSLQKALDAYRSARERLTNHHPVKGDRADVSSRVEHAAEMMGEALGAHLFPEKLREKLALHLERARRQNIPVQFCLESVDPDWSALPLECLKVPTLKHPVMLKPHVDVVRLVGDLPLQNVRDINGPLKILIAVAAPWQDGGQQMLDYEAELGKVMDIVESLPDHSNPACKPIVHILDQGTLEDISGAFEKNSYHILHISCHGSPGMLVLEQQNGYPAEVSVEEFIDHFPMDKKPVFTLLSACHTGGVSGEVEKSFAETLVAGGFPYVVAMQSAVSDAYATRFCSELYQQFAYKERIIERAFTRVLSFLETKRKSENANRAPEEHHPPEWMVPALYKSSFVQHAIYEDKPERFSRTMEIRVENFALDISHRRIGEFVGRREDLIRLKNDVLGKSRGGCALLTGPGGVGKSTLAARALADYLGGKKQQPHLVTMVGRISLIDFLQQQGCSGQELQPLIDDFFNRFLPEVGPETIFLFDNFEDNLQDQPDSNGFYSLTEQTTAFFFSQLLQSNTTRVLVTSRYPFVLPHNQHQLFERFRLGALSVAETRKLIGRLEGIEPLPQQEKAEIVRQLGGHPRILEYLDAILRDGRATYGDVHSGFLKKLSPEELELLQKQEALPENIQAAIQLAASDCFLDALLLLLSDEERELLYCISVFYEPRSMQTFDWLIRMQGWSLTGKDAIARLEGLSLVSPFEQGYVVHRWTAEYLRKKMGTEIWKKANILAADHYMEPDSISIDDGHVAMRHYLQGGEFDKAHWVALPLENQLEIWGHWEQRAQVIDTMLSVSKEGSEERGVWLQLIGILNIQQGDYDNGQDACLRSLAIAENLGDQSGVSKLYHHLGILCQFKGEYDDALEWYLKSLAIKEKLGDQSGVSKSYHHLGMLCEFKGEYDDAQEWYLKSLTIKEKLGDQSGVSTSYHQLGILCQLKSEYDDAQEWYLKSLAIKEKLGDQSGVSTSYHQLGMLCQYKGEYDDAQEWYLKSLAIKEKLGDQSGVSTSYHQLGILCQLKGEYDDAQEWYLKSLAIIEKLGNQDGMANSYGQLGLLLAELEKYQESFSSLLKAFFLFHQLGSPLVKNALNDLCDVAGKSPDMGRGWLAEIVDDEDIRNQLIELIDSGIDDKDEKNS